MKAALLGRAVAALQSKPSAAMSPPRTRTGSNLIALTALKRASMEEKPAQRWALTAEPDRLDHTSPVRRGARDELIIVAVTPAVAALARIARAVRKTASPAGVSAKKAAFACNPRHDPGSSRAYAKEHTNGCS